MDRETGNSKSIIEQIHEETLQRLRNTELFDKTTLEKLKTLANNGELKDYKKVISAIQSEVGVDDENSGA